MATLQNCIDQTSKSSEDLEINCDSKSVLKKLAPNGLLRFELDILAIHVGLRVAAANVAQIQGDPTSSSLAQVPEIHWQKCAIPTFSFICSVVKHAKLIVTFKLKQVVTGVGIYISRENHNRSFW